MDLFLVYSVDLSVLNLIIHTQIKHFSTTVYAAYCSLLKLNQEQTCFYVPSFSERHSVSHHANMTLLENNDMNRS